MGSMKCRTCKFGKLESVEFMGETLNAITCRRFPSFETKQAEDWCGEYQDAPGYHLGAKPIDLEGNCNCHLKDTDREKKIGDDHAESCPMFVPF